MNLIKKRRKSITLVVLIVLALFSIYILKSGSESFAILDMNKMNNINDPILNIAIKATEECNKLETYKNNCYRAISWNLGKYSKDIICEKLKEELKLSCYQGYGRLIGEKYSPDIKIIQDKCSKIEFYEECLIGASRIIGEESAKHIETEQCKKFEQEEIKQMCYEGIGIQLARANKELSLCEEAEGKERCLQGFASKIDQKGDRKRALQICNQLSEEYAKRCYLRIGTDSIWIYSKNIKEVFKECEQYPYPEMCKKGVAGGVAVRFFEEKPWIFLNNNHLYLN